ncbi:MAG: integration host factor subunit beta [Candidatus Omnitrophica bacterium]|nr:integration host factor subunit beta [Candidatus Omnitrophota bacterium]
MIKKEMISRISEEVNLSQKDVKKVVQGVFDNIKNSLIKGERVELRNFGVFKLRTRRERKRRNPRTGEGVLVPAHRVVVFKPARTLRKRVK